MLAASLVITLLFGLVVQAFAEDTPAHRLLFAASAFEGETLDGEVLEQTKEVISRRLESAKTVSKFEVVVTQGKIEVLTPPLNPQAVNEVSRLVTRPGSLSFAVMANRHDHGDLVAQATTATDEELKKLPVKWCAGRATRSGQPYDPGPVGEIVSRVLIEKVGNRTEFLLLTDQANMVGGEHMQEARLTYDTSWNPLVSFILDDAGASVMEALTRREAPARDGFRRRLAVLFDGEIHSAPTIAAVITRHGAIQGEFNAEEAQQLVDILNCRPLPCRLQLERAGSISDK